MGKSGRPPGMKKGDVLIERNSDISEWGEKEDRGSRDYQEPFMVAGEAVDLDKLPPLSENDKPKAT